MIRQVDLEEISDGKLYGLNDMARVGCDDCRGCWACCQGMGASVILDPLDLFRLVQGTGQKPDGLLGSLLELNLVDGLVLPNIKMAGKEERCSFLNQEGRCSIHAFRPGVCRLFPLGRYYEADGFRYFLQIHECRKEKRSKVKVHRWIDTPEPARYDRYILQWHTFLNQLRAAVGRKPEARTQKNVQEKTGLQPKEASMYVLQNFYLKAYDQGGDFYKQFEKRLEAAKRWLEEFSAGDRKKER